MIHLLEHLNISYFLKNLLCFCALSYIYLYENNEKNYNNNILVVVFYLYLTMTFSRNWYVSTKTTNYIQQLYIFLFYLIILTGLYLLVINNLLQIFIRKIITYQLSPDE